MGVAGEPEAVCAPEWLRGLGTAKGVWSSLGDVSIRLSLGRDRSTPAELLLLPGRGEKLPGALPCVGLAGCIVYG